MEVDYVQAMTIDHDAKGVWIDRLEPLRLPEDGSAVDEITLDPTDQDPVGYKGPAERPPFVAILAARGIA